MVETCIAHAAYISATSIVYEPSLPFCEKSAQLLTSAMPRKKPCAAFHTLHMAYESEHGRSLEHARAATLISSRDF